MVRQHCPEAELLAVARQRAIERYKAPTAEEIEIAKCKLLAQTVTMRSCAVRDSYDGARLAKDGFPEYADVVAIESDDPVEGEFVALFNQRRLSGLPHSSPVTARV